jgi:hypothetical protein
VRIAGYDVKVWAPVMAGALLVAAPAVASAQIRWGRPAVPRAGACFYRDAGFRGDYFCLRAGQELRSIPYGLNDEISSIRTFGNAEVIIFKDPRFRGRSQRFFDDVVNLRDIGWNDRMSSLEVRRGRGRGDDYRRRR